MEDSDLFEHAAEGDPLAFELLVRRHADGLWRLARSLVRDDHLAEEAVQDTFVKAHGALGSFRREASVRTWLSSICYRICIDRLRRRTAQIVPLEMARQRSKPEDHDLRLTLQQALGALPAAEREAFTLVHVLGHSREEAAAVIGVPASTLRSRVSRAQQRLAEDLADVLTDDPATFGGQQV